MEVDYNRCIECGRCTKTCLFLEKYNINLKEYASLEDLAYNCYLCGECRRVCPVKIDGRQISLNLRKDRLDKGYSLYRNGYGPLILEKKNYIFKNHKDIESKRAFFPGCNFLAYYPKTSSKIIDKLYEEFNISTFIDCCGKPISDLSMDEEESTINQRLNSKFKELGLEELLVVCPNCYYYFKTRLDIKVSMIYEDENIMKSLLGRDKKRIDGELFLPCPDKDSRKIYNMLRDYIDLDGLSEIKDIQCCGAGGCASIKEGELTKDLQDGFRDYAGKIYVYCATCAGMISKTNPNVEHILVDLLGTEEEVSEGFSSLVNRFKFSIKK